MPLLSNRMSDRERRGHRLHHRRRPQDREKDAEAAAAAAAAAAAEDERRTKRAEEKAAAAEAAATARKRARELAQVLDRDRDGFVGREEFLEAAADEDVIFFDGLAETFRGDLLWGEMTATGKR